MNPTTHVLRPQPPLRAFAIAAALAVVGVLVVWIGGGHHVLWLVLGLLFLGLGVVLLLAGLVSMRRLRSYVELNDEGYTVRTPGRVKSGAWDEVTKVTSSQGGAHLTLYQGQVGRTHILAPGNVASPEMEQLASDIAARLDRSRGYRSLTEADLAPAPLQAAPDEVVESTPAGNALADETPAVDSSDEVTQETTDPEAHAG